MVIKSRIKADISVLHPDSEQELHLGIQYEGSQKKRLRKRRWFSQLRSMIIRNEDDFEKAGIAGDQEPLRSSENNENEIKGRDSKGSGDDVLKEKIAEQMKDKDNFIINQQINEIIIRNSKQADLVMLGFNIPEKGKEKRSIEKIEALLHHLPDTLLINAPFDFDLFE